ncbi:hypothetical protein K4L06_01810 [Lysobacter sp. BMK333-48F3]|uniref:hypothetical protein n=1 Tax=Lysobacter sp. BMK333-48F3 TaxID=2867962 RepID=UPI001C8CE394|nr:hypothetical protein [Lysobacter sp. BMK333-48F3]MBX9400029.1 hypothetical protein [Lysobacter sp. BMK333-48F3]
MATNIAPSFRADRPKDLISSTQLAWAAAVALAFLLGFRFDAQAAGYDIDPSWAAVTTWGFEHGAQWGRDLVFTYGPLGWMSPQFSYFPSMVATAAIAQVAYAALYAVMLGLAVRALARPARFALVAVLLWFGMHWAGDVLWLTVFPLSAIALWHCDQNHSRWTPAVALLAGLACALPWLIKFSLFPLWLVWLAASPWLTRRTRWAGTAAALSSVLAAMVCWRLAGQAWSGLPRHLQLCIDVAVGYGTAMQRPGPGWTDALGLAALAWAIAVMVATALRSRIALAPRLASTAIGLATLGLAFKAGFTRVDTVHLMIFFPVLATTLVVFTALSASAAATRAGVAAALLGAATVWALPTLPSGQKLFMATGMPSADTALTRLNLLFDWNSRAQRLEQVRQRLQQESSLPRTRSAVGDAPIDIVSVGQGVIFLNDLNYRPRPVFQGYSAYTPQLAGLNRDWFASKAAPAWVLLDLRAIDGRLATSEDPQALLQILSAYQPRLRERGLLLMQRRPSSASAVSDLAQSQARQGEAIAVPDPGEAAVAVSIEAQPTLWNRAGSLVLRAPRLYLELELDDGRTFSRRIAPGAAAAGFLISPSIESTDGLWRWLATGEAPRVRRLRLREESWGGLPGFEPAYRIRYQRWPVAARAAAGAQVSSASQARNSASAPSQRSK